MSSTATRNPPLPRRGDRIEFRYGQTPYPLSYGSGMATRQVTATSGNFVEVYRAYPGRTQWFAFHGSTLVPAHRDARGELVETTLTSSPTLMGVKVVGRWI